MSRPLLIFPIVSVVLSLAPGVARAADPKDGKKKDPPRVTAVAPLAVAPGAKVTMRLRGTGIDAATEVRFPDAKTAPKAEIKSKGKAAAIAPFDAKMIGDAQVEFELTVPADAPAGSVAVVVVTPEGETAARSFDVVYKDSLVEEKEPNGGFREAQTIEPGKVISGVISSDGDVDVYKVAGKAGQAMVAEVTAGRDGSLLDGLVTLYDAAGHVVATADDAPPADGAKSEGPPAGDPNNPDARRQATLAAARDPKLAVTLPADGTYFLAVSDAGDHGSPFHAYRLTVTAGAGRDDKH